MNPQNEDSIKNAQVPSDSIHGSMPAPVSKSEIHSVNNDISMTTGGGTNTIQQDAQQTTLSSHSPIIADDADLIEKEWVNKAKLIVSKTKDDPRLQSSELYKYKADYIKKRFNKDIKISET